MQRFIEQERQTGAKPFMVVWDLSAMNMVRMRSKGATAALLAMPARPPASSLSAPLRLLPRACACSGCSHTERKVTQEAWELCM